MNALSGPLYIVTGVLLVAGVAKLARPSATATALRSIGVPSPMLSTRVLGTIEIALTIAAIATGAAVLWAGVALAYTGFTVFILWALRDGEVLGSCGCFGREDTPPTPGHAGFNAAAAAIAALAISEPSRLSDFDGTLFEGILLTTFVVLGVALAVAMLTELPRTLALARGTAAPAAATFSIKGRP